MPSYLINAEVWKSLWPIVLVALGLASFVALLVCMNKQRKELFRELFFVLTAFSMLGMVTGYLSGFSREPALGAVLPAVLSLMGGASSFSCWEECGESSYRGHFSISICSNALDRG